MPVEPILPTYLDLLDHQREAALTAVASLTPEQLWQRPAPKEWSVGEILDHNYRLIASSVPYVRAVWRWFHQRGERRRQQPYQTTIADPYDDTFPMWVGFLWTPRYNPHKPVSFAVLAANLRQLHQEVRAFYADKEEAVLGNLFIYDPYFGWLNLIVTLRIGIYHDQLHYRDIFQMVAALKGEAHESTRG